MVSFASHPQISSFPLETVRKRTEVGDRRGVISALVDDAAIPKFLQNCGRFCGNFGIPRSRGLR